MTYSKELEFKMKDCDKQIREYHRKQVALTSNQRTTLKERRDSNRTRLRSGLRRNEEPEPKRSVSQGSYAMRTVIQEPNNEYDIDDGVVFAKESLKGSRGGDKSPLSARNMVREAVHSDSFVTPPEVRTNCVRVYYNDGPHVDIPVYRELTDWSGMTSYELASAEWRKSDPDGVNEWFIAWLNRKRNNGLRHSRELIRLVKSICKNRQSYSLPSGFVITVLIEECYTFRHERLDVDLRSIISAVCGRLQANLLVRHPVVDGEWLIDADSRHKTRNLCNLLDIATKDLAQLDLPNCTRSNALRIWKKVLFTDFLDEQIAEARTVEKSKSKAAAAALVSAPKPYGHRRSISPS